MLARVLFTSLGLLIHPEKSLDIPSQIATVLGFIINSLDMTISLTTEKKTSLIELCHRTMQSNQITIRDLARLNGKLVSSFPGVAYGPLFYRDLEMAKTEALKLNRGNYDSTMVLSDDMKSELQWWVDNLETATCPISNGNPDIVIDTDASLIGWGAVCNAVTAQGSFTPSDVYYAEGNINVLELLAVKYGLQSFASIIKNRHILVHCDNSKAVSYISNMGGTHSRLCNAVAKEIWLWTMTQGVWLTITHIPGKLNKEADFGSRNFNDRTEWSLDPSTFELITKKLGQPEIDLFASYSNAKVACYYSWKPDPGAAHVDAFYCQLEWTTDLLFSTFQFARQMPAEDCYGSSRMYCSNSELANTTLLFQSHGNVGQSTTSSSMSATVTSASTRSSPSASTVSKASTVGMQIIRKSLEGKNISGHSADIILASWRSGTQKQYQTYINKWVNYCCERELDSLHPSVADVIQFLTTLFEKNLSYSSLNTARSALSTIITVDGMSIGNHPLVVRFLKGVFNLRPPVPRYKEVWDVSIVLRFLNTLSPVSSLSLKNLSLKLVMLLSLVTAQRGQTLHLLDINLMSTYDSSIVFTFNKPLKQSNPRTQVKPLVLKAYTHDESLCVFSTLKEYLQRTETLRVTGSQLLISFQKPHKAVSRDTISRWIRTVMQLSGINLDVYKAHSARAASVSAAHRAQVPVQEILRKAGWSSAQTFAIYYDKNLDTSESSASQFQEAILTL